MLRAKGPGPTYQGLDTFIFEIYDPLTASVLATSGVIDPPLHPKWEMFSITAIAIGGSLGVRLHYGSPPGEHRT